MGSPAETITRAYRGDWHGTYGNIPTPGHSQRDRGTTIKDGDNGDVVIHSHNNGDWRAMKDEFRARGLLPEAPNRRHDAATSSSGWRETEVYEYQDANGETIYRTIRIEHPSQAKRFRASRREDGEWRTGLDPKMPRVPYRLPELLSADAAEPVYFVEGERKADKLARWGLCATAIAFGAKGWREDYASHFAGRTVVILPDNDEPGLEFARRVEEGLSGVAARVAVVTLPGLPLKGDVIDWSGQGGSAFELQELTDKALNAPAETFQISDLAEWARAPAVAKHFIYSPFVPQNEVVIVTGDGGTNKSTFALQISVAAAAGRQMLGLNVTPGPALYVTAEDDDRENHWRLAKIAPALGATLIELAGKLHIVSLRGRLNNELATFDHDGKLKVAPTFALLRATIQQTGAKLVTLDNVAHLYAGNENDRSQVTAFINLLYQLCGELGVTILLIAHRNKSGDSYSGSTAWLNAVRSQILIESSEEDPDVRRLSLGKANYARQGQDLTFRWHDFALVLDKDLAPDTRKQIAEIAATNTANQAFLDCLAAATKQGLFVSANVSPSYAPSRFEGMPEARGMKKDKLALAMKRLLSIGKIEQNEVYDTAKGRSTGRLQATPNDHPERFPQTFPNGPELSPQTTPPTYAYTTYSPGAAPDAAAPSREEEQPNLTRVIFAESDPADHIFDGA